MIWLRLKLGQIELTQAEVHRLQEQAFPAIEARAIGPKHGNPGSNPPLDFLRVLRALTGILKKTDKKKKLWREFQSDILELGTRETLESLIRTESGYLVGPNNSDGKGRPHENDKYNSYLARYLVRGDSTGEPIFDEIYGEIRKLIRNCKDDEHVGLMLKELESILVVFNRHHPDTPASLEDLLKE